MITIGDYNELTIIRQAPPGLYLMDNEGNEVLLPNKYISEKTIIGERIQVFVYKDSEDRIIATTQTPKLILDEFACLQVKDVNTMGAFLDWGLEKDLMVPYSEQAQNMKKGKFYIVYLIEDEKTQRLIGTSKWNRFIERDYITVKVKDEVDVLICEQTEMGFNVIVNNLHKGLIYKNEVFRELQFGEKITAYVKNIRENNEIDISLYPQGVLHIEQTAQIVLDALKQNNGFLPFTDKSSPNEIIKSLNMSKKIFKKAIGTLYKQRLIQIADEGIFLK